MKSSYYCSTLLVVLCALCGLYTAGVCANPVYPGETCVWSIPSQQIAVPNGYCLTETVLTLYNVSIFEGEHSRLSVYLMHDKVNGFYGLPQKDSIQDNYLASHNLPLAEFDPNDITNGILRIRLNLLIKPVFNSPHLNTPLPFQFKDGFSTEISPAILQFMDYLGSSPSIAFGFYSRGFKFNSMSLMAMSRAYDAPQGTRMFLLNSGNLYPPVLENVSPVSIQEGQEISLTLKADDADNDPLSFYGLDLPAGSVLSGSQFTWIPSWTQAGDYSIRFIVSDGKNSDYRDLQLTVSNANRPPVFSTNTYQAGQVRKLLTFPVTAEDPDGGPVTITPLNLPSGSIFQSNLFSWIPSSAQIGTYEVMFIASDGSLQEQTTITIDVGSSSTSGTYFVF